MRRLSRGSLGLACTLAGLAGYVDAIGFLQLGGIFASFMSGNSTRLGIELAGGHWAESGRFGLVIAAFVAGAALGALIGAGLPERRPRVLLVLSALLAVAALTGDGRPLASGLALTLAMGVENAVFQRRDGSGIGLTYMTGALVRAGQEIAGAVTGRKSGHWFANIAMWAALVVGAALGATAYGAAGLRAVWAGMLLAGLLAPIVWVAEPRIDER